MEARGFTRAVDKVQKLEGRQKSVLTVDLIS